MEKMGAHRSIIQIYASFRLKRERAISLYIFTGKGEYKKFQRLFFMEIDRGTEELTKIKDKVIGYNLYREQKMFSKYSKFPDFTVLFQTSSEKRAANMREYLSDVKGSELVWVTDYTILNEASILQGKIWRNHDMDMKSNIKGEKNG